MSSVNCAFIIGNLGTDPETKQLGSGVTVCTFSVATSHTGASGQEETTWHRVNTFNKQAENCSKYLKKGSKVCIEGRIRNYEYTDKQGAKRWAYELVANKVTFLSSVAKDNGVSENINRSKPVGGFTPPIDMENMPF